ncbi:TonB-dependent receptor domain-containing protein [Pseudoalteromonas denitrificans]|uniref:Iron complex outermembrane recepter protein n=1 Tax=Pseudoalteromonas denitrificans DSM 6059 TaxID=1123010 RepID=A0A1I1NS15_9GAMM|nr:TonB-dependent receptor [Pseudoalteromonas denitrificans]SFD00225.1 iron complex outermembrane recepter protein [Pseudoalteromonas denitrificans DSM 6059]
MKFFICIIGSLIFLPFIGHGGEINQVAGINNVESIEIVGKKHSAAYSEIFSNDYIYLDETLNPSNTFSELISTTAGVDLNGQGGKFQVFSVRGLSGFRVQTQLSGITLNSERSAGSSTSFIDSFFIDEIEIIKGAGATFYGSGAIGGVVQMKPKFFQSLSATSSYEYSGDIFTNKAAWGNDGFSFAMSHQKEKNKKTPLGENLNSHFEQTSASLMTRFDVLDGIKAYAFLLPSYAHDIGKANSDDFVLKKNTSYPKETHILGQFGLTASTWALNLAVHKQALKTKIIRFNKRRNEVNTQSTDFTANINSHFNFNGWSGSFGLDQEYRKNVTAKEQEIKVSKNSIKKGLNLAADQYQAGIFGNVNVKLSDFMLSTGMRYNFIKQKQESDFSDNQLTGYSSIAFSFFDNWQLSSSVSQGFRFATLSERFYTGTTGRGKTLGNRNLIPETSINYESKLSYQANTTSFDASLFKNNVKNYIERVQIGKNVRSYKNVRNAYIKGLEFRLSGDLYRNLTYQFLGHYLTSEDSKGNYLNDISANKIQIKLDYQTNSYRGVLSVKHRFKKNKIAFGEQVLKKITVINSKFIYDITENFQISLWLNNLLNKQYVLTADNKSALSEERQIGFGINWAN